MSHEIPRSRPIAVCVLPQVLPRQYTDARTYNMLISVCVKAKDLTEALHAADMMRSTGKRLDTILYTNLIGGQLLH